MKEAKVVRAGKFKITVCNRKKNQESDEIFFHWKYLFLKYRPLLETQFFGLKVMTQV
ncbi:hypothetical protein M9Y82_15895 [Leptospira weilii]|uniref:Uncharacterized protein n=1 Tax=Leptospira weilii str. Ecochallenge TaxID=1049986 RepID=N1UI28_9LEPT|nr:hypothetical protein [Leptospira weilii]EMY15680.1 hypothetical protein LEP1GSC043_0406 [Leptospira weilii str. Ecochallenge]MCL8268082.1 hypothetical protein [Leptospira weilii]